MARGGRSYAGRLRMAGVALAVAVAVGAGVFVATGGVGGSADAHRSHPGSGHVRGADAESGRADAGGRGSGPSEVGSLILGPGLQPVMSADATLAAAGRQCATRGHRLETAFQAAQVAGEQWQVHIDAMNRLVSGEITLAEANVFWEQTRARGHELMDSYVTADEQVDAGVLACQAPELAAAAPKQTADLSACRRWETATDTALARARNTLGRWHRHIADMDSLRTGSLDPAVAAANWQKAWVQGQRTLDAFYRAGSAIPDEESCPLL